MAAYRIEVGKRQKVEPRQIVGALANEGGLSREDFGAIQIRPDFSLVELPADLSGDVLDRLQRHPDQRQAHRDPARSRPRRRRDDRDDRPAQAAPWQLGCKH